MIWIITVTVSIKDLDDLDCEDLLDLDEIESLADLPELFWISDFPVKLGEL